MEIRDIRWPAFETCNNNTTAAFEDMCRRLFAAKFMNNRKLYHVDNNTPGIEVAPVIEFGHVREPEEKDNAHEKHISFQSKYCSNVASAYAKFQESAKMTIKYWKGKLDIVYAMLRQPDINTSRLNYEQFSITSSNDKKRIGP